MYKGTNPKEVVIDKEVLTKTIYGGYINQPNDEEVYVIKPMSYENTPDENMQRLVQMTEHMVKSLDEILLILRGIRE